MKKWLALLALPLLGCGAELDRSSEVETLRVLGVHKTKTYARAGDELTFSMLWHDPKGREITPVWFAAPFGESLSPLCINPPSDSYYECLGVHAVVFSGQELPEDVPLDEPILDVVSQLGESITITVPQSTTEVVTGLGNFQVPNADPCDPNDLDCRSVYHPPPDDNLPDFGSLFLFFALCPGTLSFDDSIKEGFGLLCLDEDGVPLGPSDFVFGYSQIFLYEDFQNQNPVIDGIRINGEVAENACIGPECLTGESEPPEECGSGVICLDVCTEADEDDCPEIEVTPILEAAENVEPDSVAEQAYGRNYEEQMWIRYYTDRGRMASEVRLLNDAVTGWNPDYGTELQLPQESGPITLWAVVADNRGGQNWVRVQAVVE